MITLYNSTTANTFTSTFSERLNQYGVGTTTGSTFYLQLTSIANPNYIKSFSLVDSSEYPFRYNQFELNLDFSAYPQGQYEYIAFADSGLTQSLETGRLLISGNTSNNIYG